jgi:hypothetical protein
MIVSIGFEDSIDFLYMPLDMYGKQNKGYAFINFLDSDQGVEFARRIRGKQFEGRESSKKLQVCRAAAQGILANLRTIKHANWSMEEHMPLVRIDGNLMHTTPMAALDSVRVQDQEDAR